MSCVDAELLVRFKVKTAACVSGTPERVLGLISIPGTSLGCVAGAKTFPSAERESCT